MSIHGTNDPEQDLYRAMNWRIIYPEPKVEARVVPEFLRPEQPDKPGGPKVQANQDCQRLCGYEDCGEPLRPRQLAYCRPHAATIRKREQRQRDLWRRAILSVSPYNQAETEALAASVCDEHSFRSAAEQCREEDKRQREEAENGEVFYTIRVEGFDGTTLSALDATGPALIVECITEDQTRGDGSRERTPSPWRLTEETKGKTRNTTTLT
jgi:hypothetical protein